MPGFSGIRELVDASNDASFYATWRKSPTQVTTQGVWYDLSMSPGNPVPQYYAASPMVAQTLSRSVNGGVPHAGNVSPAKKFLRRLTAMTTTATALPMPMMLLDYLMFYPFIDQGDTTEQLFDNTQLLTRYTTGAGVQIMPVVVGAQTGGQTFQCSYTNQSGVAGRTTSTAAMTTAQSVNGTILTTARAQAGCAGPFLPLQEGDTGVRSIESVTCNGADVGLFTLVLVKPLAQLSIRGIDAPVELDFLRDFPAMPQIQDDAYLSFLCCPSGSLAATAIHGDITVAWN